MYATCNTCSTLIYIYYIHIQVRGGGGGGARTPPPTDVCGWTVGWIIKRYRNLVLATKKILAASHYTISVFASLYHTRLMTFREEKMLMKTLYHSYR